MNGQTTIFGCGLMGSALAKTLYSKGYTVSVWNRSPGALLPLKELGIPGTTDFLSALAGSDIGIIALSSYDAVRSVLGTASLSELSGKVIVNLSSGSAQDARDMQEWANDRNVEYLDGSIWVLPNMIGAPDTVISCAGPVHTWERVQATINLLGGASFHAGETIESGNVLEACFPGAFYMTSQHCFVESLIRAKRSGIDLGVIARSVAPSIKLLRASLDDLVAKLETQDDLATEASLDVWCHAALGYKAISRATSLPSPYLDTLVDQLKSAVDDGLGARGAVAMVKHLENTPVKNRI